MAGIARAPLILLLICTGALASLDRWMGGGICPWGGRTASGSHPQYDMPDTGETRYYDFTVSRATMAPDGVSSSMIVVNGQFPGPILEANWGDWIEVNVRNEIWGPEETTLIHWHGLNQPGTPWFDGVPSVSHCPIVPGSNLTYRFRADEYGSSFYHSHQSAQYGQGLLGPIVIHGPSEYSQYDVDLGPVVINDWYHDYYANIVNQVIAPATGSAPFIPQSQSNLVAGVGRFPCSNVTEGISCSQPPYAAWQVEDGKTYRMRLINAGAVGFEAISIDNHQLTVIANDFIPVQPYNVDHVVLAVAQRTDVIFTANGSPGQSYWLRAWNDPLCGQTQGPDGRGIIAYTGADTSAEPTSTGTAVPPNTSCATDDLSQIVPVYSAPVADPDVTITITINPRPDSRGVFRWFMNDVSFQGDTETPMILQAITQDNIVFPPGRNVYDLGSNKTIRVILQNTFRAPHPMHLHGHDFQVLAQGAGTWDGAITNPSNPNRRDVQMLWGGTAVPSYIVLQWYQDNPGIWPLHCHISWHLSVGMVALILERPDDLVNMGAELPSSIAETCTLYAPWQAVHGPSEDDSGLKVKRVWRA